jgi:Putative peptidoglycan binding domain
METLAYLLVSQDYASQGYEVRCCSGSKLEEMLLDAGRLTERLIGQLEIPKLSLSSLAAVNLLSLSCAVWLLGLSSGAIAQTYESDGLYPSSIYAFTTDRAYSDYYNGSSTAYLLPEDSIYPGNAYYYVRPNGQSGRQGGRAIASPCNSYSPLYPATDSTAGYVPIAPASSLQIGDSGDRVRSLQNLLQDAGYFSNTSTGYFGPATESAVIAFQQDYGLMVDGVAGSQTIAALQGG